MQEPSTPDPGLPEAFAAGSRQITDWLWAASLLLILPLVEYLLVAPLPVGTAYLCMLPGLLFMPAVAALVYVVASPVLLIPRRTRWQVLRRSALCLVLVVTAFAGLFWGAAIRDDAFQRLAVSSGSLVTAIQSYEHARGAPPPALDALVPEFLAAVPGTGMAAYPAYEYFTGQAARRFDDNPWVLSVPAPHGGINFDRFLYFPRQNYPKRGYGGSLQRIHDWAYVHE